MRTIARGNGTEAAVLNAFIQRGFGVLVPFGDGHPYDLAVDLDPVCLRVQCKTAWVDGGCLRFNAHSTDHGHGPGSYVGRADAFGVHFPVDGSVYLVAVSDVGHEGRLRIVPTRNNQRRKVRLAADYEIDRWPIERLRALVSHSVAA